MTGFSKGAVHSSFGSTHELFFARVASLPAPGTVPAGLLGDALAAYLVRPRADAG
ncbi:hypothetical protein NUM_53000 [Actinocatenispora comari]|jgi:hypothetical protein|uniref:Uncharacterized protein n=1 Tax=Actinocatenispora comari TaxID=2807577 RepID=A0A8J4AEV2_9ACTN|nr:hypothetical protein NUM_53000 [Actinocatenispora comari]